MIFNMSHKITISNNNPHVYVDHLHVAKNLHVAKKFTRCEKIKHRSTSLIPPVLGLGLISIVVFGNPPEILVVLLSTCGTMLILCTIACCYEGLDILCSTIYLRS